VRSLGVVLLLAIFAGCGGSARPHRAAPPVIGSRETGARRPRRPPVATAVAQQRALRRLIAAGRPVFCGGHRGHLVALTFDDGPGPYTGLALKELGRAHARATFFLVGRSVERFPQWPRRERRLAAIGDHTQTHPLLTQLAPAAAAAEIAEGRERALAAAGPPVQLFRPPYGGHDALIDGLVSRAGMVEVLWSIDSGDSQVVPPLDYAQIARNVATQVRPGSIVLMHENRGQTIRALRTILPMLRRRGLRSVTVPELLAADPPTSAQLAAGLAGCSP
jgi:peptidoglycan/xylan/chitin deacetylase (PgdA/CDA1 family)